MSGFSHFPLQQAIYQTLTNDSTLMALVESVFDRPPQDSDYPYVTLGDSTGSDHSNLGTIGMEQLVSLQVWSREGGRKEAATIMERIYTLLHQAVLTVSGQTLLSMQFVSSSLSLENDGWTYQGIMRFHAVLQAN